MILRSYRRRDPSFHQLLRYLHRDGRALSEEPLFHNLAPSDPDDLAAVAGIFTDNADRFPPRKNGVCLYHEIISLSGLDAAQITPDILRDLARKFLELRAPEAAAYGVIHFDTKNPHIHLVIAAHSFSRSPEAGKLRLTRSDFARVKRELERYQRERYPELVYSRIDHDRLSARKEKKEKEERRKEQEPKQGQEPSSSPVARPPCRSHTEHQRAARLDRQGRSYEPTRKDLFHRQALEILIGASSPEDFRNRLEQEDIRIYERRGVPTGLVTGGRKYRFATLGLDQVLEAVRRRWERLPERRGSFRSILAERTRLSFREFGFAWEIMDILRRSRPSPGYRSTEPPATDHANTPPFHDRTSAGSEGKIGHEERPEPATEGEAKWAAGSETVRETAQEMARRGERGGESSAENIPKREHERHDVFRNLIRAKFRTRRKDAPGIGLGIER